MRASVPIRDLEFGLLRTLMIGDLQFQILGTDALLKAEVGRAAVVACVRTLAVEESHQFMLAGLQVADIQPLYAAFEQRRYLARRVKIVADVVVVDLEGDRVECDEIPDIHRNE